MNIQRNGNTVFELNSDGVNLWSFHVQPGRVGKNRTPDSMLEEVATKVSAVEDLYKSLGDMMTLARLKWGNLDEDFNALYEDAVSARAKYRGESV